VPKREEVLLAKSSDAESLAASAAGIGAFGRALARLQLRAAAAQSRPALR
jgi:hypothetical protein